VVGGEGLEPPTSCL